MSIEEYIDRAIISQQTLEIEYCTRNGKVFTKTQYFYLTADGKSYAIVESATMSDGEVMTTVTYVSYDSVSSGSRQLTRGSTDSETIFDNVSVASLDTVDLKRLYVQSLVERIKSLCKPLTVPFSK